ncbi:cytochrome oxidase putative small subunit CydP [Paraburkholderia diazotrophica]|nr:cytochrome oxidase putative small subunit CydP [Paraburkholderia diazotrophica]
MAITLNHRNPSRRALSSRIVAWARGPTFARDIAIVLAVKFALLLALKLAFFDHPQAQHMSLPPAQVAQALLSVPVSPPSQGDNHAR